MSVVNTLKGCCQETAPVEFRLNARSEHGRKARSRRFMPAATRRRRRLLTFFCCACCIAFAIDAFQQNIVSSVASREISATHAYYAMHARYSTECYTTVRTRGLVSMTSSTAHTQHWQQQQLLLISCCSPPPARPRRCSIDRQHSPLSHYSPAYRRHATPPRRTRPRHNHTFSGNWSIYTR